MAAMMPGPRRWRQGQSPDDFCQRPSCGLRARRGARRRVAPGHDALLAGLHLGTLGAMAVALVFSLEPGAVVLRLRLRHARRELRLAEHPAVLLGRGICVARTRHAEKERHGAQQTENLAHRESSWWSEISKTGTIARVTM